MTEGIPFMTRVISPQEEVHYRPLSGRGRLGVPEEIQMPTNKRTLFPAVLLCFLALPGFAQERTLTLQECLERARNEDLSLKQSRLDTAGAAEGAANCWALFLPATCLSGEASLTPETGAFSLEARISLPLDTTLKAQAESLSLNLQAALLEEKRVKQTLEQAVTAAFYNLLLAEETDRLNAENLALAEKQLGLNQSRYDAGLISETVLLQTRLERDKARLEREKSRSAYQESRRSFLTSLGLSPDESWNLEGGINPVPGEINRSGLAEHYLTERIDLRQSLLAIDQKKNDAQQKAGNRLPAMTLTGAWNMMTDNALNRSSNTVSATLSLSVPLEAWIPGSGGDQAVSAAERGVERSKLAYRALLRDAEEELYRLLNSLEQEAEQIRLTEMQVNLARRSLDLSEEGFRKGTIESLELEEARKEWLSARLENLNIRYNYLITQETLKAALGIDDIKEIMHRSRNSEDE